ncbi:MAG: hypothetical protein ABSG84_12590 [Acidobacteriaceae bacterium]|jgi:hypothetical protein
MKTFAAVLGLGMFAAVGAAQGVNCNMQGYKAVDGVRAVADGKSVTLTWQGEAAQELRAQFSLRDGQPVVEELAARKAGGAWVVLGKDLTPQFEVTTGRRRMSKTEKDILVRLHQDTPENEEIYKWNVFWDAPLAVPGLDPSHLVGPARTEDEIKRAAVSYKSDACSVKTDGDRVSVRFDGLSLGLFAGDLQFTAYKGSNLLRQEALASTEAKDVAFIYKAGLKGFAVAPDTKVVWRDTAQVWQENDFGGDLNQQPVNVRARNRLEILDTGAGSLGILPPPHKFFFARENEVNLGYVYYRKDNDSSFSLGVMQPEQGEGYAPWGISDEVWRRRTSVARSQVLNYALYNAPPGTVQRMAVYYYLSPTGSHATQQAVMAYTHDDVYKPIPGFKTVTGHFHLELNEMVRDHGTADLNPSWIPVFRGLGINIVYLGDFHDDSDGGDPGPKRLPEQKAYFEASRKLSDKNFLVMPEEEANSYLDGHWYLMSPKAIYFTHSGPRREGQPFEEEVPGYGTVYHLGSADDVLKFVNETKSIIWVAHPRTKSSALFPDMYKDKDFFLSDRFIGGSWESLPVDLSQERLCEVRCFGVNDDMSNWAPKPKFFLAEGDTYMKRPDDESYPTLAINYLKLDKVPAYDESWAPVVEGIHEGNFFGTTGEILFHKWGVEGAGAKSVYTAEFEYTFPLEFAEVVWSDGTTVDRKLVRLTDTTPFGTRMLRIPFDATGKKWVRCAVWDSAGDGAWTQPVLVK